MAKEREFLISTADVAFYYGGALAFTGTTSLNTSLSVTMEDLEIAGGKKNKLLYKMKYGRRIAQTIEMAEWNLAFIAANSGSKIVEGLLNVFSVAECVQLTNGVGTLKHAPAEDTDVFVELDDGSILKVTPVGSTITVGDETKTVLATYRYDKQAKRVTIDADSEPFVGELVLTAERHNNRIGKVGETQIYIPSFKLSGNFDISLESTGNTTTAISGDALAVKGDTCESGEVYAYITDVNDVASEITVADIVATPATATLAVAETVTIEVVGIKGGMYENVKLLNSECTFTSGTPATATVSTSGVVTAVATGTTIITVAYGDFTDTINVTVSA